jgi:hypothetical protein
MKKLLALALVLMVAGGAMAQAPFDYVACEYRMGLFPSSTAGDFEITQAGTNYDYTAGVMYNMNLVIFSCPEMVSAYELNMTGLPASVFATGFNPPAGSGWINIGTLTMHIAAYGFPQPNPDGVIYLGAWQLLPTAPGLTFEVNLGPSVPSSVSDTGIGLVVGGELWRANYSNWDYSGCPGEWTQPAAGVPSATANGIGIVLEGEVAVESMSLSNVKALFN